MARNIYAVSTQGKNDLDYFEADSLVIDKSGVVSIVRFGDISPIAIYSVANLIGIVNLSSGGLLDSDTAEEKLRADSSSRPVASSKENGDEFASASP